MVMMGKCNLILLGIFTLILHDVYADDISYDMCIHPTGTDAPPDATTGCTFTEDEGFAIIEITITQPTASPSDYSSVKTADGTALPGVDYHDYEVVIPVEAFDGGTLTTRIYIPIIDDNEIEDTEAFTVNDETILIATGAGEACTGTCSLTITITDNDVPCVSFPEPAYVATEGAAATTIGLEITNDPAALTVGPVSIGVTCTDISATITTDYTLDPNPVDLPTGEISLTAVVDALTEDVECCVLSIDPPVDPPMYKLGTRSTAKVCIIDAPGTPVPCVSFDKFTYVVVEGVDASIGIIATNIADPATVDPATMIGFTTSDITTSMDDHTAPVTGPGTVAFGTPITVTCPDETLVEGVEAFEVTLTADAAATPTYTLCTPSIATVFCLDPVAVAAAPVPCVSFLKSSYFVTEGGDPTSIELVLSNVDSSVVAPVSVAFTVTPVSAIATDYAGDSSPVAVTAPDGEISVAAMDDGMVEGVEAFQICIDPPTTPTDYKLGTTSDITVWILDAAVVTTTPATTTTPALVTYWIQFCDYKADESQSPFMFYIKRSTTEGVATITCSTRDVSATGNLDFEPLEAVTATFPAGSDTTTCSVTILPDVSREDPEVFEISISSPSTGELGDVNKATVTLYDSSSSVMTLYILILRYYTIRKYCYCFLFIESKFCLTSSFYPVLESSSVVNIGICRKGDVSQEGSVVLTTSNVDAIAPNDYEVTNQRISFDPNEICKTQDVAIVDDELLEPAECFQVSLSQPSGGLLCIHNSATVYIKDDDSGCTPSCQNDGVCNGQNRCMCPAEYTGPTCETLRCPTDYCLNGGTCVPGDNVNMVNECQCSERFEGLRCETRVPTGLSGGAIAGIVVGVIVGLVTLGIVLCVICMLLRPRPSFPCTCWYST
ncbi:uncharacterized protein [Amphiura filiformis]|uniref:uncharacterized protein n=1 Tax=Amphiura filiformis TaxID=82378 RepID=UPI003B2227FB